MHSFISVLVETFAALLLLIMLGGGNWLRGTTQELHKFPMIKYDAAVNMHTFFIVKKKNRFVDLAHVCKAQPCLEHSVKFGGADCRLLQPCINLVQEEKANEKEMVKCLDKQQKRMSCSIFHQLLA